MIKGRCHCGRVAFESAGKLIRYANCHCDDCRKVSGAVFSSALVMASDGFRITEGEDQLSAYESSPGKFRCFCKHCSAPIVTRFNARPEIVILRAGVLDQDDGHQPQIHIWVSAKVPWVKICDDLPQFPEMPK